MSMSTIEIIEVAKFGLQIYFALIRNAGLTPEEEIEMLMKERAKFQNWKPLPEVQ